MLTDKAFIVAKFRPNVAEQRITELLATYGLEVQAPVVFVHHTYRLKLKDPTARVDAARTAARLEKEREVQYAEPAFA